MLLRCAVDVLPGVGGFADAASADVEFQSSTICLLLEAFQITFLEVLKHMQFGDEHGVELQRSGVVNELRRLPAGGAHREVIETEGEFGTRGSLGKRGCGGGGERLREEGAAVHAAHASGVAWSVDNESADDQFHRTLALAIIGRGDEDLGEVMAAAPWGTIDGLDLKQVGTGADVAERGDVVAKGSLLSGHFEILHQGEVIFGQIGDRPAAAADKDQDVGGM